MHKVLTADQFLTSILAMLKLNGSESVEGGAILDLRFEQAYEALVKYEHELDVKPNFTFFRDPLHGNSTKLRNALLTAKENGLLSQDSERMLAYSLRINDARAESVVSHSPLPKEFLVNVVEKCFLVPAA